MKKELFNELYSQYEGLTKEERMEIHQVTYKYYECHDGQVIGVATCVVDPRTDNGELRHYIHQRWSPNSEQDRIYVKLNPDTTDILVGHLNLIEPRNSTLSNDLLCFKRNTLQS